MAPLIHRKNVWSYNKQISSKTSSINVNPTVWRISSGSPTGSYSGNKCSFVGILSQLSLSSSFGRKIKINLWIGLSSNFFFPDWVTRRRTLRTSLSSLGSWDFCHSAKWPLVPRAGLVGNNDNITDLAVGTDFIPFLTFLLKQAVFSLPAAPKTGPRGIEFFAIFVWSKDLVVRNYPEGVKLLSL